MIQKLSRKGRNPGTADSWLETLGYYRKNVAYDETCLFRAVSEQLFNIQNYHERVRNDCLQYLKANMDEFLDYGTMAELHDRIEKLEKHMIICGSIELQIISRKYKCNITVFDGAQQQTNHITDESFDKTIMLCVMNEDHYDTVFKLDHIATAGFCQSIVYKILYEDVFEIPNVDDIVHGMLYEKTYITTQSEIVLDENDPTNEVKESETKQKDLNENSLDESLKLAPFPFKVAKALDPSIYRNIEYDSWTEVRREMRLGEWYYGDDKLILGTRCILNDENEDKFHDCYIQDIMKEENKCVVYITKLAEKRIVNYTDLSPENDAKPWPLPYRFSKNLNIYSPPTILSLDKIRSHRRRKEKNRTKSESSVHSNNPQNDSLEHNVNAYVGAPLQMQQNSQNDQEETSDLPIENNEPSTQNLPSATTKYQWEQPVYSYPGMVTPIVPESFSWPSTPVSPGVFNFNVRPVMTALPSSPSVMHFCDVNQSPVYNYPMGQYHYSYQSWPSHPNEGQVNPSTPHAQVLADQNHNIKGNGISQKPQQSNEATNHYIPYQEPAPENMPTTEQQPMVCSPMPRVNTQMGVYSPVMTVPPGTPVIYSPPTEMMLPSTPIPMYSQPIEMPYVVQDPYAYSSTPSATWYPVGVNAQGFVFPIHNANTKTQ